VCVCWLACSGSCGPEIRTEPDGGGADAACMLGDDCGVCQPGAATCVGDTSHACASDGSGLVDAYCDPVQGMHCDSDSGRCVGACAPENLGRNYVGCEYYASVTGNEVDGNFTFAVVVSNPSSDVAHVRIEDGGLDGIVTFDVAAHGLGVRELPWVPVLKACMSNGRAGCWPLQNGSARVPRGAYHVRSTQPVIVYQFNPLDHHKFFQYSQSNDASLLLPVNALGRDYYVASWTMWPWMQGSSSGEFPGFVAVTATQAHTRVTFKTTAPVSAGPGVPALAPGQEETVTLEQGDVAQLFTASGDLTGSFVSADKPVHVIGGHYCTRIPFDVAACDHLEESMFPLVALGNRYLVSAPASADRPDGTAEIVRVVATQANTVLTFNPGQNAPTTIAHAGEFVELDAPATAFEVRANHKVLVVQYMRGQGGGADPGDPSMTLAVPVAQYRREYGFHAPNNYTQSYVDVLAPLSAAVSLDGEPVTGFMPIGSTGYAVARMALDGQGAGDHTLVADQPFGINVYGYAPYTSYWYPGGLDLQPIVVE